MYINATVRYPDPWRRIELVDSPIEPPDEVYAALVPDGTESSAVYVWLNRAQVGQLIFCGVAEDEDIEAVEWDKC